ncbi:MAG TPA: aminotransferase class I/II-fold pyridoxal phosphate-dependent enzyme, partial [Pseudomonadales bacterium]|nr:aminotransferase class I/II-fold pyridoxal phosphate-dependent enzyme [Pseudomonadales bacterium]
MSCDYLALAVSGVQKLSPYVPGKPVSELERELGISNIIKLASNENPLGPSPKVIAAIQVALPELTRYPDGNGFELKKALAEKLTVKTSQITLGNGSNDVLEIIARAFLDSQSEAIFS